MQRDWDIFCNVIDNYGDIGVCWRLARQIAAELREPVRLWVDDLAVFARLQPQLDPLADRQVLAGVTVCHWTTPWSAVEPAAVVIEAFACNPPEAFLHAMAQRQPKPVWINLDYLSAEQWVEGCHALGSRHPRLPLNHHFFFPGFTPQTGGLLRETGLLSRRRDDQADPRGQHSFLTGLGLPATALNQTRLSLFCYDNPALPALLHHWQQGAPITLLVADGKPRQQVAAWLGEPFAPGSHCQRGALSLLSLPFLSQDDYDRLLWRCDLNFVRGEDSFVRAQWAARPLCWHIYPQQDDAHLIKLAAFTDRYVAGMTAKQAGVMRDFWLAWNHGDGIACSGLWPALCSELDELKVAAQRWSDQLAEQADLLTQLRNFVAAKQADTG